MRRCPRTFVLLLGGGVRCRWACGTERDFPDEVAVDVDLLAERLPQHHHHHRLHRH